MKNKKLVSFLFILCFLQVSCTIKKTTITIIGGYNNYLEIHNGNKKIFEGKVEEDRLTDLSQTFIVNYNFSDSIQVIRKSNNYEETKKIKIKKCKYIYIDIKGLNFKIYGTNKKRYFL